jgi:phosphoribosylformimino-5-aminoimidazole carboxamide ribotide isomerase
MEIIPAVDIKGGKCVRLVQGDHNQVTVYGNDPARWALNWEALGAKRLHIVDLDGAAKGEPQNIAAIRMILKVVKIPLQVGGGVRRLQSVEQMLKLGVKRVILGTAAVENESFVKEACRAFGDAIIIGLDFRGSHISTGGWMKQTQLATLDVASKMVALGAKRFICTDISKDGTLTEPNFAVMAELVQQIRLPIIASGGISTIEHLKKLSEIGVEGAIVGKALYTLNIDLKLALAELGHAPTQAANANK